MRTGLFFGTFNPVHRGHEALVSSFLSSGKIDDLWIILTPSPPHKNLSGIASFKDRWHMLTLAFAGHSELKLSDIEKNIRPPHYTVKTLAYLKNRYPERSLFLCIGGDSLQNLPSWYEYKKIAVTAKLLVAERPGVSTAILPELKSFSVHFCDHKARDISSSGIRKSIAEGNMPGSDELHPAVSRYIRDNHLYCEM